MSLNKLSAGEIVTGISGLLHKKGMFGTFRHALAAKCFYTRYERELNLSVNPATHFHVWDKLLKGGLRNKKYDNTIFLIFRNNEMSVSFLPPGLW